MATPVPNPAYTSDLTPLEVESSSSPEADDVARAGDKAAPPRKSGVVGATANLLNGIVGAGIIGIPYALKHTGLVAGIVLLGVVAALTVVSSRTLIEDARACGVSTYEDLAGAVRRRSRVAMVLRVAARHRHGVLCVIMCRGAPRARSFARIDPFYCRARVRSRGSTHLIATCHPPPRSHSRAKKVFGRRLGRDTVLVAMTLLAFGAMCAYLILIGDTVPALLRGTGGGDDGDGDAGDGRARALAIVAVSACGMLPLSLLRDVSSLEATSAASAAADGVLVVIVAAAAPYTRAVEAAGGLPRVLAGSVVRPASAFAGLGAMSFAFVCQHSCFLVANSLDDGGAATPSSPPFAAHWARVTRGAIALALAMCAALGVAGYLARRARRSFSMRLLFPRLSVTLTSARSTRGNDACCLLSLSLSLFFFTDVRAVCGVRLTAGSRPA